MGQPLFLAGPGSAAPARGLANTRLIPFLLAVEFGTLVWLLFTRKEQAEDARWT